MIGSLSSYVARSTGDLRSAFARVEGQALIEYALIISLLSMVVLGTISMTGSNVGGVIGKISGSVAGGSAAQPGATTTIKTTAQAPAKAKKKKHG